MKYMATVALMLNFGIVSAYANQKTVKMTFSGTETATNAIDLQVPDSHNGEFNFAGSGALGSFTFRLFEAESASPQQSSACQAGQVYFPSKAGAGVFRFEDGSLLKTNLTDGFDCIDFVAQEAHCTRNLQITGGTGRFKDASGSLTLTETVKPVLADAAHNPVFFAATGEFTATISGVAWEQGQDEDH